MAMEIAPNGALTGGGSAVQTMKQLPGDMRAKLNAVQQEMALLSGRVDASKKRVKLMRAKVEEIPLVQELRKKELAVKNMEKRLDELQITQAAIIQLGTGNLSKNLTMAEIFDEVFGEVDTVESPKKLRAKKHE